jgi:hypothetical protein
VGSSEPASACKAMPARRPSRPAVVLFP